MGNLEEKRSRTINAEKTRSGQKTEESRTMNAEKTRSGQKRFSIGDPA